MDFIRKFRPLHMLILRLHFQGWTADEIGQELDCSAQTVYRIVGLPESLEILEMFQKKTVDTILDISGDLQAVAPAVFEEKLKLALKAKDERVRNIACTDILNMAGHSPIKRVQVEQVDPVEDKYKGKSAEQIRKLLAGEGDDPTTIH